MGQPRPLFRFFGLYKQTLKFLQQIYVKKCPSSIRCRDSNPRPLEYKSLPMATRPYFLYSAKMYKQIFLLLLSTHFLIGKDRKISIKNPDGKI